MGRTLADFGAAQSRLHALDDDLYVRGVLAEGRYRSIKVKLEREIDHLHAVVDAGTTMLAGWSRTNDVSRPSSRTPEPGPRILGRVDAGRSPRPAGVYPASLAAARSSDHRG